MFLFATVLFFLLFKAFFLWNLHHDVLAISRFEPNQASKENQAEFLSSLEVPDFSDGSTIVERCSDFESESEGLCEAISPGSYAIALKDLSEKEKTIGEAILWAKTSLASLPPVVRFQGKEDLTALPIQIGTLTDVARSWEYLGFSSLMEKHSEKAYWLLLGAALVGIQAETSDPNRSGILQKMVGIICYSIAGHGFCSCAQILDLPKQTTREVIFHLKRIASHTTPFADSFKQEALFWKKVLEQKLTLKPHVRKDVHFWNPGFALSMIQENPKLWEQMEKSYFQPLIETAPESYLFAKPKLEAFREFDLEIKRKVRNPGLHWVNYYFVPENYLCDVFPTHIFMIGSLVAQSFAAKQHLLAAQWALAVSGFHQEKNTWPGSPKEIENWLGDELPNDVFTEKLPVFRLGPPLDIRSVGPDQKVDTEDDIPFIYHIPH
jgi:hypothetical protein